jgi:hypothetical protein
MQKRSPASDAWPHRAQNPAGAAPAPPRPGRETISPAEGADGMPIVPSIHNNAARKNRSGVLYETDLLHRIVHVESWIKLSTLELRLPQRNPCRPCGLSGRIERARGERGQDGDGDPDEDRPLHPRRNDLQPT